MNLYSRQFLDWSEPPVNFQSAAVAVLPIPYEGGVSYGRGTAKAPDSVIESSRHLELYDEVLKAEPHRMGIVTIRPPEIPENPALLENVVYLSVRDLINAGKFTVMIGGDHSITYGYVKAFVEKYGRISVIQLDAHADLRKTYDGSPFSHGCIMSRVRELTRDTLQIGIRSMSLGEADRISSENLSVCTMEEYRTGGFELKSALVRLPDPAVLTIDVDVFDWSVIRSTGTPEPGGLLWDEALHLIKTIFARKKVVGFDVVELSADETDRNSSFAVAKLIYKMLGFKLASSVAQGLINWPEKPAGSIFR
ncbi:MAG: agmatinase [Deltaproteobacteria bacterium]|nr:agmatinase [Deltaproteobacteria bacterium]